MFIYLILKKQEIKIVNYNDKFSVVHKYVCIYFSGMNTLAWSITLFMER